MPCAEERGPWRRLAARRNLQPCAASSSSRWRFSAMSRFPVRNSTLDGLIASVSAKDKLLPSSTSIPDSIGREIFGTANNFVAAPDLGAVVRAWLSGQIPSLVPYAGKIVSHLGPWLITTGLIFAIYLRSARQLMRGAPGLIPFAFLCGAHAWTIYCNLNDPEHWYALTVPTVVLFLTHFPDKIVGMVLPIWAAATAVLNLVLVGIPVAHYPLRSAEAEVRREFNSRDLLVYFAAYPGKPYLGFFLIPEVHTLQLDTTFRAAGSETDFFETLERSFHETWDRGGRVIIFDILDPYNWNAPWMVLKAAGMPKSKLMGYITEHYAAVPLPDLAGLKVWRLDPRAASDESGRLAH